MPKRRPVTPNKVERICLLSSVWPFCYSTVVILSQSYLIYQGSRRYYIYKAALSDFSAALLCVICITATLLPVVVLISFIKLGSYTNDAVQVGYGLLKKELSGKGSLVAKRIYRGAPPVANLIHVICAFLLLITNVFLVAKGKQLGIFEVSSSSYEDVSLDTRSLTASNSTINYLTGDGKDLILPSTNYELANLVLTLLIYSYRTVSVFWRTSRLFTLLYWTQLTSALILHTLSYLGLQALYTESLTTKQPGIFILDEGTMVSLYVLGNSVLFISSWCVFHFGYGSVLDKIRSLLSNLGHNQKTNSDSAYVPHALALGSILLYVGCNAPIMYDYVTMYSDTSNWILIAHLIACVIYMLLWIILWFAFTVKQSWQFNIDEIALKRYAILQNRPQIFPEIETEQTTDDNTSSRYSGEIQNNVDQVTEEAFTNSEDNISNSTSSTANGGTPRSSGILSYKAHCRQKKKTTEQKVKFQEATKIVIETNLDSDLDTIPESDTECADSAMFSGSGSSNDSNESQLPQLQNTHSQLTRPAKPRYKDLILNPRNIELFELHSQKRVEPSQRMCSSTGDLNNKSTYSGLAVANSRPRSVISQHYTSSSETAPYTPRNHISSESIHNHSEYSSSGHKQMFDDPGMSSAV